MIATIEALVEEGRGESGVTPRHDDDEPAAESAAAFVPSATFAGARAGHVFTTRARGTGYYEDPLSRYRTVEGGGGGGAGGGAGKFRLRKNARGVRITYSCERNRENDMIATVAI